MTTKPTYMPTEREQAFLDTVENPKYDRQIINGLDPFFEERAPEDMKGFYTEDEIAALRGLQGTERDVESRMPVKMTRHYFELAKNSPPLQRLVKASPDETLNLAGLGGSRLPDGLQPGRGPAPQVRDGPDVRRSRPARRTAASATAKS